MSVKVSTWVWHSDATQDIRATQLVVLLALADIADDNGNVVFVDDETGSQAALATKARMSIASFRRITYELRDAGFIEISRASQTSLNKYRVRLTAQNERSLRALAGERSEGATVSGLKEARSSVFNPPNPPQSGGNEIAPSKEVLDKLAAAGLVVAAEPFRICNKHRRQRKSCLECFTPRKITSADLRWCGDRDCDEETRMRILEQGGRQVPTRCPECHPAGLSVEQVAAIVGRAA